MADTCCCSSCLFFPTWLRYLMMAAFLALPAIYGAKWLTFRHHLQNAKRNLRALRVDSNSLRHEINDNLADRGREALAKASEEKRSALCEMNLWEKLSKDSVNKVEMLKCYKSSLQSELNSVDQEKEQIQSDILSVQSVMKKVTDREDECDY